MFFSLFTFKSVIASFYSRTLKTIWFDLASQTFILPLSSPIAKMFFVINKFEYIGWVS